jgi:solute carrier family 25 (mitochondrial S-adenosylmethionine transporter), member 26
MSQSGSTALVDGLSGGLSGAVSELIFYSLDSFKVQRQAGEKIKFSHLFRGAIPIACCGSLPSFGIFFGIFHQCKQYFCETGYTTHGILFSSILAAIPSSIIAVPADVMKKRIILGYENSIQEAALVSFRTYGMKGFFLGWEANLLRDVPFAGLKITLYEGISYAYLKYYKQPQQQQQDNSIEVKTTLLTPIESAIVGLLCGPITALITSPLDCVNTRIKSGELASYNFLAAHVEIVKRSGFLGLYRGLVPRTIILSCGSTVFWFWFSQFQRILGGEE